jgi:uncharacterized protein
MQLKGTYRFDAPKADVWEALLDPKVLAQALPGGDELERLGENEYKAALNVRVGPVQGKFEGKVELADIQLLTSYRMKVSGQGAPGFVTGEGAVQLEESDSGTLITYHGDVQIGGRIASVGQRLLDSTARSMLRQGFRAMDDHLQRKLNPQATPPVTPIGSGASAPAAAEQPTSNSSNIQPPAQPAPSPSSRITPDGPIGSSSTTRIAFEVAKDVAKDLAGDYIPPDKQERVLYMTLGALAMLLFVVLVRLVQDD